MKRQVPFSISKALSALKRGKVSKTDGLLLPTDIIKKILACLPARECWRIATQLNHSYNEWARSTINIYTCHIEVYFPKFTPMYALFTTRDKTQARFKGDFENIEFGLHRNRTVPQFHIGQIDLLYTIKENDTELKETKLPLGCAKQNSVLYTFEKNVTLCAKLYCH